MAAGGERDEESVQTLNDDELKEMIKLIHNSQISLKKTCSFLDTQDQFVWAFTDQLIYSVIPFVLLSVFNFLIIKNLSPKNMLNTTLYTCCIFTNI